MDSIINVITYITLTMSVTILFIFCVKIVFEKKLSPRFNLMLWLILLARVAFPILPQSPTSIFNVIDISEVPEMFDSGENGSVSPDELNDFGYSEISEENLKRNTLSDISENNAGAPDSDAEMLDSMIRFMDEYAEVPNKLPEGKIPVYHSETTESKGFPMIFVYIYIFGFAAVSTFSVFGYRDAKRKLLETACRNENQDFAEAYENALDITGLRSKKHPLLYTGDSSVLLGIRKPVIIIDRYSTREEAEMIILHELNHYMNFDNFYLFVSSVISCVFWFNPLVWFALHSIRFDLELFCDYKTLSKGKIKKDRYAMLLFTKVDGKRLLSPISNMSAAGRQLKSRIKSIARIKNKKYMPRVICAALAMALCALCLTNPIVSQSEDKKIYIGNFKSLTQYSGDMPAENASVTAEQFYGMLLVALNSFEFGEANINAFSLLGDGTFDKFIENVKKLYCLDENIDEFFTGQLNSSTVLTREKTAFILDMVMNYRNLIYNPQSVPENISEDKFTQIMSSASEDDRKIISQYYKKDTSNSSYVTYYLKSDTPLSVRLKFYNIFENSTGQNTPSSGIITQSDIYNSGYIAKIDITVFEKEILPFIEDPVDCEYIKSIYEYDNEGYYINVSREKNEEILTYDEIERIYEILIQAINSNENAALKKEIADADNPALSEYMPLIRYMPEEAYKHCLKTLKGDDLEYFRKLYPIKGNADISNISSETYTVDEFEEIMSIITDIVDRDRFSAFYTVINNSLSKSPNKEYFIGLNLKEKYPQYGDNEKYYLRDPYINEREEKAINSILEKYIPGNKADMYYISLTGADGEYEYICELYKKSGLTPDEVYDINAYSGCVAEIRETEITANTYYSKNEYDEILDRISDKWMRDKVSSFFTLKNITSSLFLEPENFEEYVKYTYPGLWDEYISGECDMYYFRDPEIKDREINQLNGILTPFQNKVLWRNVLDDFEFKDFRKSSGYIFEESVHRVHATGIMTNADDTEFGYQNEVTFGDAAEIVCRFMSGITMAY